MAKVYAKIGFFHESEVNPGVWKSDIEERFYYGDMTRMIRRSLSSDKVNDDMTLSNQLSIVADPFANDNFHAMRYVTIGGANWKITDVEIQFPRLILSIGGLYNGKTKMESSGDI